MKRFLLILPILIAAILPFFIFKNINRNPKQFSIQGPPQVCSINLKACRENMLRYLKLRKDKLAQKEIEKILSVHRDDTSAMWAEAEILRRSYKFRESEELLNRILASCPAHSPSLVCLAYIKYRYNKFQDALKLLSLATRSADLDKENLALAYLIMGSINAKKASQGGIFSKLAYGMRVRGFFEKAKDIAPDMSEAHLGLGSFYLLAPKIVGGDVDKAVEELECAVKLTPDFASANARLAQAYRQKGNSRKYDFYIKRAKELDPGNEIVKEIECRL